MRTLAIDSATEACSAALFEGNKCLGNFHAVIGRGHAERLVPAIADLPGKGRAQRILVSLGPGSFTGTRIGLAAARALGLAWNAQVLGYPTLALVAAMARGERQGDVTVCMTGGHGEWFVQSFSAQGLPLDALASLKPQEISSHGFAETVAGSQANTAIGMLNGTHIALDMLPDARHALDVPASLLSSDLSAIYGRPPDARLPGTGS